MENINNYIQRENNFSIVGNRNVDYIKEMNKTDNSVKYINYINEKEEETEETPLKNIFKDAYNKLNDPNNTKKN